MQVYVQFEDKTCEQELKKSLHNSLLSSYSAGSRVLVLKESFKWGLQSS